MVIAATANGVDRTTVTVGLIAALRARVRRRGIQKRPDYLDLTSIA
jgi:cobyrinic acid a,c-diamide synthase